MPDHRPVAPPKPVNVRYRGLWVTGQLVAWRREQDRWWGFCALQVLRDGRWFGWHRDMRTMRCEERMVTAFRSGRLTTVTLIWSPDTNAPTRIANQVGAHVVIPSLLLGPVRAICASPGTVRNRQHRWCSRQPPSLTVLRVPPPAFPQLRQLVSPPASSSPQYLSTDADMLHLSVKVGCLLRAPPSRTLPALPCLRPAVLRR